MEKDRKRKIISGLVKELYNNYDEELLGSKTELERQFTDKLFYENKVKGDDVDAFSNIDKLVKADIKAWIRDKLENDIVFLEKYMSDSIMEGATEDDINTLLKMMLRLRNESFDFFFGKTSEAINGLRRLNTCLEKGNLAYAYEDLYIYLLNKWNAEKGGGCKINHAEPYRLSLCIEEIKARKPQMISSFYANDRAQVRQQIRAIMEAYDEICQQINWFEGNATVNKGVKEAWLLRAVMYIDFMLGMNRDILLMMSTFAQEETVNLIIERYICDVRTFVTEEQESKNTEIHYSLVEKYLLITVFKSISNERLNWREIQEFLNNEIEEGKKCVQRTSFHKEDVEQSVEKILQWFSKYRNMNSISDSQSIRDSIYTECFLLKKPPKRMKRFGIKQFLEYIDDKKQRTEKVMSYEELFYLEKIIRGIYRENNLLERYLIQKKSMVKVYTFESELLSKENMKGNYLGIWAHGIYKAINGVVRDYLIDVD